MRHKKILIINTGGTLSAVIKEQGLSPDLSTLEMSQQLHMVAGDMELSLMDFRMVDSANIFPEDWTDLAGVIAEKKDDYDGIVVIHGTDTCAYSSSMLTFMLQNIDIPVVLTGSQLSIADPVADAWENIRYSIYMAASGYPGVFVAFNRKVMLGCRVSKVRSLSFDAFESINYPDVASISALGLKINESAIPKRKGIFQLKTDYSNQVAIIKMFPGIQEKELEMFYHEGYKALYIEGYGLGGIPFLNHDFVSCAKKLIDKGMTILLGTQCRYEGSNMSIYETGRKAIEAGIIQAYDMSVEAAITKLMWVLGQTDDPKRIREYFSLSLSGEVTILNK